MENGMMDIFADSRSNRTRLLGGYPAYLNLHQMLFLLMLGEILTDR